MADDGDKPTATDDVVTIAEFNRVKGLMQTWQAKATDYEKRFEGIDPDKAKADSQALKDLMKQQAQSGDKKDVEKLLERVRQEETDRFSGALSSAEKERDEARAHLKHLQVTKTALSKAAALFHEDALEFIESKVTKSCDFEDGDIVVKDDSGKARDGKDPRKKMSVDEFLEELAEKYPSLAKPIGSGGAKPAGVKTTGQAAAGEISLDKYLKMTNAERAARLTNKERMRLSHLALSNK
jgi:hypothetical protein